MKMKVKIPLEEIVPKISHFPLQRVYDLLEDFIVYKLPEKEILSKYVIKMDAEESLLEIIPWFQLDEYYCSNCGKIYFFEANCKREVLQMECRGCGPSRCSETFDLFFIKGMAMMNYRVEQEKRENLSEKNLKKAFSIPASMVNFKYTRRNQDG
ncbi:MAG: hypothetical protein JEZ14_17000 [Marinilabiliaceae bacterium]|nr:hypothetical protein [Marinilabiliaceae bacterium]